MRNIFYSLTGIMLLLGITACSEEERYATSVVKEIQLFLDDEPWAVNTGASNKPLFIYHILMGLNCTFRRSKCISKS